MQGQDDRSTVASSGFAGSWDSGQQSETERMPGAGGAGGGFEPTVSVDGRSSGFGTEAQRPARTVVLRPGTTAPLAFLIRKSSPREGQVFRLNPMSTSIGRDAQCDIVLDDEACSRVHGKVKIEPVEGDEKAEAFYLYDLASENGTTVNGKPILKHALSDGDEIEIGHTILVFKKI